MKAIREHLRTEYVGKRKSFKFGFLEFLLFWNSPDGKAIVFGNPAWLMPLIAVPYMLAALVYNFRGNKYFVRRHDELVGLFVLKVKEDALIVHTLAVSPMSRKRGVGFFILQYAECIANRNGLKWLELTVLKGNMPAQRLYAKFGFKIHVRKRLSLVLRKRLSPC